MSLRQESAVLSPGPRYEEQQRPRLAPAGTGEGPETLPDKTIRVSDATGAVEAEEEPKRDWMRHSMRVMDLADNAVRHLRKRQVLDAFTKGDRNGAYWGVRADLCSYGDAAAFDCPFERTLQLAQRGATFKALSLDVQERLINWGYAVCDAALRSHYLSDSPRPNGFIYSNGT